MKKAYEVTYKDGNEIKRVTVKGCTLINALVTWEKYPDVYDNLVSINEISCNEPVGIGQPTTEE